MVSYITELNDDNYKDFVKSGLVLIDIKTEWCKPCSALSPIIDEISTEYLGKIKVGKIDADYSREIVAELNIRNIPAILIYKDGEIVEKSIGSVTKQKLIELINNHLQQEADI